MGIFSRALSALPLAAALVAFSTSAHAITYTFEEYADGTVLTGFLPGTDFPVLSVSGVVTSGVPGADGKVLKLAQQPASPSPYTNAYLRTHFTHVEEGLDYWGSLSTLRVYVTAPTTFYWYYPNSIVLTPGTWQTIDPNWFGNSSYQFRSAGEVYIDNVLANGGYSMVPEPSTWALLISGFGLAGAALRRRRAVLA